MYVLLLFARMMTMVFLVGLLLFLLLFLVVLPLLVLLVFDNKSTLEEQAQEGCSKALMSMDIVQGKHGEELEERV